jgi:hypothetical protein
MTRLALPLTVAALAVGLAAAPAQADQARTFVSAASGDDGGGPPGSGTNTECLRTSPCKTFGQAAAHTLANGEITVLDPGSYGAVTITQNISIVNDGVGEAGILVSGGNTGITINAPGAAVTLRGLTIKGIGFGGGDGILFLAGKALNVENCSIRNLGLCNGGGCGGNGIAFVPNTTANLTVTNTTITDNEADGIAVIPQGSATATGFISGVGLHGNGFAGLVLSGVQTTGTIRVTVKDSQASNNSSPIHNGGGGGFLSGPNATLILIRSVAANHGAATGVAAEFAGGVLRISQSVVMANAFGWIAAVGGVISTYGDNTMFDNASNSGALTPIGKQ